ncbi:MAG: HlyD family efflux transporter periplasmic adaptor subunit [Ginsengibacter sp.]
MQVDPNTYNTNGTSEEVTQNVMTKRFQSRSEAAQEIISHQPTFLEKWALLLFLAILILLIAGTWFIRYPDIIEASGILTADNAPKEIVPLQSGRLIKLFVKNGDKIKKDEMIGWIESTANTGQVLELSAKLDSSLSLMVQGNSENVSGLFNGSYQSLGELQIPYQAFNTALQQYNDYLVNGFYLRQKKMLINGMAALRKMNSLIGKQKTLTSEDKDSSTKSLAMNKILLDEKVISPEEYRGEVSKLISKQMAIPQLNESILTNQNQQRDQLKELEQLEHDISQQKIIFEQAIQTLKSNVDDWKHKYILQSPLDGTVIFTIPLQQNKFIQQSQLLGYINPPDSKFYAEIYLPQNNFGKVDTGMQVQLRFDAYPYQETGFVKGKLNYISTIATDSGFYATVHLSDGLNTNFKKHIQYKNGLRAQAIIITKNMRLLNRMYYSVVKATSVGK